MFRAGDKGKWCGLVPHKPAGSFPAGSFVARGAERASLTLWVGRLG